MPTTIKVAFIVAFRQIQRSSPWATILIIFVMMLTFLNLVVTNGILVGLIQGSEETFHSRYSGDVMISQLIDKPYIKNTTEIVSFLDHAPQVKNYVVRYIQLGTVEAAQTAILEPDEVKVIGGGSFEGIDPEKEATLFGLSKTVIEGAYLTEDDYDQVLLGSNLLYKYAPIAGPSFRPLRDIGPGSKVRITIGTISREVTVKGIVRTKNSELDQRIYMNAEQLREIAGRSDYEVNDIAVLLKDNVTPEMFRDVLKAQHFDQYARIQVWYDALPQVLRQIKATFSILSSIIGGTGIVVAAITIFIVIFVNIITRRKFIGILKGIGISPESIEMAYVFQSVFYAICGSVLATGIIFILLKPYIDAHPIDFPFSDGILVATVSGTLARAAVLLVATICAGYIPARMIVRKNTLDAILGR